MKYLNMKKMYVVWDGPFYGGDAGISVVCSNCAPAQKQQINNQVQPHPNRRGE